MADIVDKQTRSRMMARIRGKNTGIELEIRKGLHALGFRYRLGGAGLPGRPDVVLPMYQTAIFIHGCFWHGHCCHLFRWPKSRPEFWREKITKNRERDSLVATRLHDLGWSVETVWECEIRGRTTDEKAGIIVALAERVRRGRLNVTTKHA